MEKIAQDKIEEIAKKYDLKLLLLFGSQVSGKTHPMSDFDFGYIGKKDMSYQEKSSLDDDLSRLVKGEADTVDLRNAGSLLKYEIIKNNEILYDAENKYEYFFVQTLQEYFESKKLFVMQDNIIANKINEFRKIYA